MSTSIVKQMLINSLNVSSGDLLDQIKSFCFYDAKTWETISFIKTKKERINYLLNNETFSRANPFNHDYDHDNDEHWAFWVENEDDGRNPQFQGLNCRDCGNYISINPIIPNNIKCFCHYDNDWDDENDEDWNGENDEDWNGEDWNDDDSFDE
jgi:hypothetical protein